MDLRRLTIFCDVYRLRSYSAAAKALRLTQSAVSQQVRALEGELCVSLFDANDRSSPTAAGDYLAKEGRRILAQIGDLENGVRHAAGLGEGRVRFGMIDVAATGLLPRVLRRFSGAHPQVRLEALVKTSGELVGMVERHELDLAVVVANHLPEAIAKKEIYEDSIVAVVPSGSPLGKRRLSVRDLRGEPLILYPLSSHSRMLIEDVFRRNGVVPTVNMEMHYPAAMLSLVQQGMGVGLISELSAREMRAKGLSIVPIEELAGARKLGVIFHRNRRLSPQARELMRMVVQDTTTPEP